MTLIGPGGVGKTRLAVEAAATLREEQRDGAWLVEFASVTEPGGVAPAVAGALGAAAAGLIGPPSPDSAVELIVRYLAGRSLLVVFDNCEHVIDQAAALAETLAGTVPGLRLIATSREPLGVPGEVLVSVGPLARPAAVELFVDTARAVRPGLPQTGTPVLSSTTSAADWTAFPGRRTGRRATPFTDTGHAGGTARRPPSASTRKRRSGCLSTR